ncbi:hypothetical protein WPS_10460 [Vulcanimicrobium alpinum]|uniref:DUF2029 domain-containing protein n=1 Tax=Vulcanimicrobium alpinum TaxID=3016050 RepID=A0AAN1XVJ1_UNVUL|nr:glycosyltransferase 87 family protein [Vulcanimicrobium alpinum]BDE05770.1 hypothetical protein WPS_10460 [Vulcanimicrobium alpinum]
MRPRRSTSPLRRSLALAGALIAILLAFTLFRPPPTSGPYARDFEAYEAAGATWNAGGDPYGRGVSRVERTIVGVDSSRDELLPYVGPAAALPLFGALARLPHPVAVRIWSGIVAATVGALVLAMLAVAGATRVRTLLAAFAFALIGGPATSDIALGQAALPAAAGIALALCALERMRPVAAAAGVLLAGMQPNLALALIARMRDRAALAAAGAGFAAFALLTLWAGGGVEGFAAYVRRLASHGAAERFVSIQHTPAAVAWALGAAAPAATALGTACALAAFAAVAFATVLAKLTPLDGTLLGIAALPLAIPFFHEHDFVVETIPLLVLAVRSTGRARALAGIAAALVVVDWFGLAQREPAHLQIFAQGLAVACAFAALGIGARCERADAAPLAAFAIALAAALPLAIAAPAPTWPDALPAGFRAPAGADASAVWEAEQHAAGLDTAQPAWGALRALPLAGCIVLGLAIVLDARSRRARRGA